MTRSLLKQKAEALKEKASFDAEQLKHLAVLTAVALKETAAEGEPFMNREIIKMVGEASGVTAELRRDLLDQNDGILPRIERRVTQHNGRLSRLEKIMWVLGTAIVVLGATKPEVIKMILSII